jgi:cyclase
MAGSLTRRVIPCLDVKDGRVVKGVQFAGLRDAGDPASLAAAYEAQGADEIVVLDVSATIEARGARLATVDAVRRALSIPLTVGGGVRSVEDAAALLEAGADRVAANSAAVRRPQLVAEIAERFGRQCAVVAIDAKRVGDAWRVVIDGGRTVTALDAIAWAQQVEALGAGELLVTSWDRDGSRDGYDLALLDALAMAVSLPVIASGGADGAAHMERAFAAGADAALAASIFHDGDLTVADVKTSLAELGVSVRTPPGVSLDPLDPSQRPRAGASS